jgi:uncharacterized protein (TIGR03382 family)
LSTINGIKFHMGHYGPVSHHSVSIDVKVGDAILASLGLLSLGMIGRRRR